MIGRWLTNSRYFGRLTWFLRKATASSLEHRLICHVHSLRCRVLVCDAVDTASLATRFLFGKLFCVATLFDFEEKRCRKNLPLADASYSYMGAEFRIEITPIVESLDSPCDAVFAGTDWQRIPTSLVEHPNGIGVQSGAVPRDPSWPHVVDICSNDDGTFYAVAHCTEGVHFLNALKGQLETAGHSVVLNDDYY